MCSNNSNPNSGQIVLPGERLGIIEEFIPDACTYVKDGVIYSITVGRALFDFSNKKVSVYPLTGRTSVPKVGSVVLGHVSHVQSESAGLRIFKVDKKPLSGVFSGVLHVSDVQLRYVESMFDVCRVGDILRGKVVSDKNRIYHLSTKDKNLGVVYALCSRCGNLLELRRNVLHCSKCGKTEKRKITLDYGKEIL